MKKHQFKQLALMGLMAGMLAAQHAAAADAKTQSNTKPQGTVTDPNAGNMEYHLMTEDELMLELNPTGVKMYKSLDAEGKKLALQVASQMCNGTNKCAGLNACQDDNHSCAGKGSCAGKSKCAFSDKNLAVKVVADKMAKKRAQAGQ